MNKFETFCPLFPGFYGTVFEYDNEGSDIDNYNEENGTDLGYDDFDFNYPEYRQRVAKAFVSRLENELTQFLPVKINYQELVSPREYNFANDSINVSVELDLNQLLGLIRERKEKAQGYFREKYTSCSGFISFHSPYLGDWLNASYILAEPAHRIGALLDCLASLEINGDDIYYWADGEYYIDFSPKSEVTA